VPGFLFLGIVVLELNIEFELPGASTAALLCRELLTVEHF
jgi:hypothetical protein